MSNFFGGSKAREAANANRMLGDRKRDARAWADAADAYKAHLEADPSDFGIWVQYGNCSKEAGRLAAAEQAYKAAVALHDRDADVRVQLGHLYKRQGRKSEALKAYEAAAVLDPDRDDARGEIASLVRSEGKVGSLTSIGSLRSSARSLDDLLAELKANPQKSDVFNRYFRDFVPE